jgi:hypothetical protein
MASSPSGTTAREPNGSKHFRTESALMREPFVPRLRAARGDVCRSGGAGPQGFRCGSALLSAGAIDGFLCDAEGRERRKSRMTPDAPTNWPRTTIRVAACAPPAIKANTTASTTFRITNPFPGASEVNPHTLIEVLSYSRGSKWGIRVTGWQGSGRQFVAERHQESLEGPRGA